MLALSGRLGNVAGQASTLNQLAGIYDDVLGCPKEAVPHYRQANRTSRLAPKSVLIGCVGPRWCGSLRSPAPYDLARFAV